MGYFQLIFQTVQVTFTSRSSPFTAVFMQRSGHATVPRLRKPAPIDVDSPSPPPRGPPWRRSAPPPSRALVDSPTGFAVDVPLSPTQAAQALRLQQAAAEVSEGRSRDRRGIAE